MKRYQNTIYAAILCAGVLLALMASQIWQAVVAFFLIVIGSNALGTSNIRPFYAKTNRVGRSILLQLFSFENVVTCIILAFMVAITAWDIHSGPAFVRAIIFSIACVAVSIEFRLLGISDLGASAYLGFAATLFAHLTTGYGFSFLGSACIAVILSALLGIFISCIFLRMRSHASAFVSLAFAEIFHQIGRVIDGMRGIEGIGGIPSARIGKWIAPPVLGWGTASRWSTMGYGIALLLSGTILVMFITRFLRSRPGMVLRAETVRTGLVQLFGHDPRHARFLLYVLCTAVFGFVGVCYASVMGYVHPDQFGLDEGFRIYAVVTILGAYPARKVWIGSIFLFLGLETLSIHGNFAALALGLAVFFSLFIRVLSRSKELA